MLGLDMKVKTDFVTNSSSTGYMLTVFTNELTARDFVEELFKMGLTQEYTEYTKEEIISSLEKDYKKYFPFYNYPLPEKYKSEEVIFGDEDGTIAGRVFDYDLRYREWLCDKFKIVFHESHR